MLKSLEDAAEKAFSALMELKGIKKPVYILFNTANFTSAGELAELLIAQKQGGLISTQTAIEELHPDWTDKDRADELLLISNEEKAKTMMDLEKFYPKDVDNEQ